MARCAALDDLAWSDDALDWFRTWAWAGITITADDMRNSFRAPPHPNQIGAAFQAARKAKIIKPIGYTESKSPSRNGAVIRVWRGTIEGVTK